MKLSRPNARLIRYYFFFSISHSLPLFCQFIDKIGKLIGFSHQFPPVQNLYRPSTTSIYNTNSIPKMKMHDISERVHICNKLVGCFVLFNHFFIYISCFWSRIYTMIRSLIYVAVKMVMTNPIHSREKKKTYQNWIANCEI